jgi:hypothetical protein
MSIFFCIFSLSCGQLLSLCPASRFSCAILSPTGLLELHATNLGSLSYFLACGLVLPNRCSSKKLILNGEFRVCSLLSLVLYPKCVYFASLTLTLTAEYWGTDGACPLNKAITIT